jgi:hypothetical protein
LKKATIFQIHLICVPRKTLLKPNLFHVTLRQSEIGIILTQRSVFCTRSKHSIRLFHLL